MIAELKSGRYALLLLLSNYKAQKQNLKRRLSKNGVDPKSMLVSVEQREKT